MLSRELCRFDFMPAPAGLTVSQADRAASLYAETHAPYAAADYVVVRQVEGYGIWWWDAEQVRAIAPQWRYDAQRISPETVLQPPGDGWRQVACLDGFEAQHWLHTALTHSTWRRRPFTRDQWAAFVQSVEGSPHAPPAEPPAAERLELLTDLSWRRRSVRASQAGPRLERLVWAAVAACVLIAAGFFGQGIRATADTLTMKARLAELKSKGDTALLDQVLRADLATLQSLAEIQDQPNPLVVAAELHRVLANLGLQARSWATDQSRLRAEVPLGNGTPVAEVATALEASPLIEEVVPQFDVTKNLAVFHAAVTSVRAPVESETQLQAAARAAIQAVAAPSPARLGAAPASAQPGSPVPRP
jgi:hypothetical protein